MSDCTMARWSLISRGLIGAAAGLLLAVTAQAQTLSNGNFSTITGGAGSQITGTTAATSNAGGWYTNKVSGSGCTFIVDVTTAGSGFSGPCGAGQSLWNSANGGFGTLAASPAGGNFLASDSDYHTDTISQDLVGMVTGATYMVSFYQAGAGQYGYGTVATTDQWTVTLGGVSKQGALINVPLHTITSWTLQQLVFVATAANMTLSFLANGTPVGQPPYALLDGVTITAVPEPATGALIGAGLLGLFAARRKRG